MTHPTHTHHTHTYHIHTHHTSHMHTTHTHHTHVTQTSHTHHTHTPHIYHTQPTHHTHLTYAHTQTLVFTKHRQCFRVFSVFPGQSPHYLDPLGGTWWCPGLPCSVVKVETSQIWPLDMALTGHALQLSLGPAFPNLIAEYVGFQTPYILGIILFMRSAFCCYSSQRCVLDMPKCIILSFFPFWHPI